MGRPPLRLQPPAGPEAQPGGRCRRAVRAPLTSRPLALALVTVLGLAGQAPLVADGPAERQTRLLMPRATARSGPTLLLQTAHNGPVTCMSLRADGAKLVSGGQDGYAIIYDVETGVVERTFPWHPAPLTSVSLSPDGHYLACGLMSGQAVVWDLAGKAEPVIVDCLLQDPEVRYSPRGDYLAICGLPSPSPEGATVLLCRPSGTEVLLSGNCVSPLGLSFTPDGSRLVVLHASGALVADLKSPGEPPEWAAPGKVGSYWEGRGLGAYAADTCVAAPSGSVLALGGRLGGVPRRRWGSDGVELRDLSLAGLAVGSGEWAMVDLQTGTIGARWERRGDVLAFSRDGSLAFEVGGGRRGLGPIEGRLTDLRGGAPRALIATGAGRGTSPGAGGVVARDLVVSADGTRATAALVAGGGAYWGEGRATSADVGAATWDLATGELLDSWWVEPSRAPVRGLHLSPDGGGLVAQLDNAAVEWNLSGATESTGARLPGVVLRSGAVVRACAKTVSGTLSTDGRYTATVDTGSEKFVVFDASTGEQAFSGDLSGSPGAQFRRTQIVAFWVAPDDSFALTAQADTVESSSRFTSSYARRLRLRRWVLPQATCAATVDLGDLPAASDILQSVGLGAADALVAFSPDGQRLAVTYPGAASVAIFDVYGSTTPKIHDGLGADLRSLSFSPDGRVVAAGCLDGSTLLWEVDVAEPQARLSGHLEQVNAVCFTRDGRLATGSSDGSIALWDTRQRLLRVAQQSLRGGHGAWPTTLVSRASDAARMLTVGLLHWLPEPPRPRDPSQLPAAPLSAALFCFRQPSDTGTPGREGYRTTDETAAPDPDWLVSIPQGCYDCSPDASSRVAWLMGDRVYPFDQFEDATRRPEVVRSVLAGQGIPRSAVLGMTHAPPEVEFRSPTYGATIGEAIAAADQLATEDDRAAAVRAALDRLAELNGRDPAVASRLAEAIKDDPAIPDALARVYEREPDLYASLGRQIAKDDPNALRLLVDLGKSYASSSSRSSEENSAVTIRLAAQGAWPIERISLSANGRPVDAQVAAQLTAPSPTQGEMAFTCRVPVPTSGADLRLRAVAYDTSGATSRPAELLLRGRGAAASQGDLIVLAIGLSKYRNEAWNTIEYADEDARDIADALASRSGVVKFRQVLTNEDATASAVKFALRSVKDVASEDDTAIVFVAGHGVQPRGDDYYFLCHDSVENDLPNTALPWSDFTKLLAETRARRIIILADTCHSGAVVGAGTSELPSRPNGESGAAVLAASQSGESSIEDKEWGHGAFTYALLEGLKGAADHAPGTDVLPPEPKPAKPEAEQPVATATEATGPMPSGLGGGGNTTPIGPAGPMPGGLGQGPQPAPQPPAPAPPPAQAPVRSPATPAGGDDAQPTNTAVAPGVVAPDGTEGPGTPAGQDDAAKEQERRAGDGVVTIAELEEYVTAKVQRLSNGRQHPLVRLEQVSGDEVLVKTGQAKGVTSLVFGPGGRTLLSTTSEGALWDLTQNPPALPRRLQPPDLDPNGNGLAGALSPDGRWVATCSDFTLSWWDAATGALCDRWALSPAGARPAICFSADASLLLYGSPTPGDVSLSLHLSSSTPAPPAPATAQTLGGGPTRRILRCMGVTRPILLSPTAEGGSVLAANQLDADGRVALAEAPVYTPLDPLRALLTGVLGLPDQPATLAAPAPLQLSRKAASETPAAQDAEPMSGPPGAEEAEAVRDRLRALLGEDLGRAPSPEARSAFSVGSAGIWVRSVSQGRLAYVHEGVVADDGLKGLVLSVIALDTGRPVASVPLLGRPALLAISDDGRRLACVTGGRLLVRDTANGALRCRLPAGGASFTALALSPDGSVLATGTVDGAIELWDASTGAHQATLREANRSEAPPR